MQLNVKCNLEGIQKAAMVIMDGGIAIFPTDTVYGIGCDPRNAESVQMIYDIKSRDPSKPLPVLVHSIDVAQQIAKFDDVSRKMAERFWPGQLTMLLDVTDDVLKTTLNLGDKIAVRVPDHKCTLRLLGVCGMLVGTSANISGQKPFADPIDCPGALMRKCDIFVDGGTVQNGGESTIIECLNGEIRILREGILDAEALLRS